MIADIDRHSLSIEIELLSNRKIRTSFAVLGYNSVQYEQYWSVVPPSSFQNPSMPYINEFYQVTELFAGFYTHDLTAGVIAQYIALGIDTIDSSIYQVAGRTKLKINKILSITDPSAFINTQLPAFIAAL